MNKLFAILIVFWAGAACASNFGQVELTDRQQPITDGTRTVKISPYRELATANPVRLAGTTFSGLVKDTNFWTETVFAGATATQTNGGIELATTSYTTNDSVHYNSVRRGRYIAGNANFFRGVVRIPNTSNTSNLMAWGACDGLDGAYWKLQNGTLSACTRKYGVESATASASFNVAAYTIDDNVHVYEVWWSNSRVWYYVDDVLRHVHTASNAAWTGTVSLPIILCNTNYGGMIGAYTTIVRVASIYRFGQTYSTPIAINIPGAHTGRVCKYGPGQLHHVLINTPTVAAGTCTIYDNTAATGRILAAIDLNKSTAFGGQYDFDCPFDNGLTVVTTGTGGDVTIILE